ncbi:MAG: acetyl-CoA carboxylase carboxyl transferase subunit beta [Clostridia bacterium]|nr:acetyl-CoA carboxylase carboxyl transferase subunit beta [Clostridia bacterium]
MKMTPDFLTAQQRLEMLLDPGTQQEMYAALVGGDPLGFPGYMEKMDAQREKTGMSEALVCVKGEIEGAEAVVCVLSSAFFMGSMGTAVGEKLTLAVEYARDHHLPLITFSASGGARMQEGIYSLMQMAKTSAAVADFQAAGGLYISVLTHPTTGGVIASFASLGDIMLAEPGALIGFAGPRVIEQTIGQKLPEGFQRSEFQQEHGFVDQIVPQHQMRAVIAQLLRLHKSGVKRA